MSDWRKDAACGGMAPLFDVDYWIGDPTVKETLLKRLAPIALMCERCPVRQQCEAWADDQVANFDSADWVAGGFLYRHLKHGGFQKTAVLRRCAADGCPNVIAKGAARFCCWGCRSAGKVPA